MLFLVVVLITAIDSETRIFPLLDHNCGNVYALILRNHFLRRLFFRTDNHFISIPSGKSLLSSEFAFSEV